jgi:hypothetical protein
MPDLEAVARQVLDRDQERIPIVRHEKHLLVDVDSTVPPARILVPHWRLTFLSMISKHPSDENPISGQVH